jgi:tRNA A-37 threonylcarbamoyl transferase component Bud32
LTDDGAPFPGTDRFHVVGRLGAGGMGVVYEAFDAERGTRVALKTLREMTPKGLLRLKNEFRALQDLRHRNLVRLYELRSEQGRWFFVMELVLGVNLLDHVRPKLGYLPASVTVTTSGVPEQPLPPPRPSSALGVRAPLDEARLRDGLRQLAEGVSALHAAGKIHRDIKPSNVLVTPEGRVVLLDFGLATEYNEQQMESSFAGTVEYMAPEQAATQGVQPASDWYSVGVILYEALSLTRPHRGPLARIYHAFRRGEIPSVKNVAPDAPADLVALCDDLLRHDPAQRPEAPEVLRRLGASEAAIRALPARATPFLGRERDLEALGDAYEATRAGRAVTVFVHGESGVGKTALVRHFTQRLQEERGVVVLWGRYYERELVPFRAFDGVLDDLARFLLRLPRDEARDLLPAQLPLLAEVFPVLRGLTGKNAPSPPAPAELDPRELRRLLYEGVRELFRRVAELRPLALVADDVQWADLDSRRLFSGVMRPPGAPAVLVLATDRDAAPAREAWLASRGDVGEVRHLTLDPLSPDDASRLAAEILDEPTSDLAEVASQIAREAGGHPLFIGELARQIRHAPDLASTRLRLEEVLQRRIRALDPLSRRLLDLVSLCPGPLLHEIAARALDREVSEIHWIAADLRTARLLHPTVGGGREALEPYHDRVRVAALSLLEEDARREAHRWLAEAYEALAAEDTEALATHWLGAEDRARASRYLSLTAAKAGEALAFERAARLYRQAIELESDAGARWKLEAALGAVLVNAGRGEEAARAYLAAARAAPAPEARDFQRRAADQLLRSGRVDEGLATARDAWREAGLRMARSPRGALFGLLGRRVQLRLRGVGFRERAEREIPAHVLEAIDMCWALAAGLGLVETIYGAHFQTRHLLLALQAGEPARIARALSAEAAFSSADGGRSAARTRRLSEAARALAARVGQPYAIGWAQATAGFAAVLEGRWRDARHLCDEAEATLRQCTGVAWELSALQFFRGAALWYLGDLPALTRHVLAGEREAKDRGDLFGLMCHRANYATWSWLAEDDPEGAREGLDACMRSWSHSGFHVEHWWDLVSRTSLALYGGRPAEALAYVDAGWVPLYRSLLPRTQLTRSEAQALRGSCRLAVAAEDPARRAALLSRVDGDARRLEKERMPWTAPFASLLRAGAVLQRRDAEEAVPLLLAAESGFGAADMRLYEAAVRRRRGEMLGGDEGRALTAGADAWMEAQGIRRPDRFVEAMAPGLRANPPGTR